MIGRSLLFRKIYEGFARPRTRKLYTDSIYPYPHEYIRKHKFPSTFAYRETWEFPSWVKKDKLYAWIGWRSFWTWFFYQLYTQPAVLTGHGHFPDPKTWTDAELGIPPDEEGSYYEWLERLENK